MSKKRGSDGEFGTEEDLRRMAMKHASLKQEYNELQRETRAMKKRLQRAKLKKENLLAEVRFLRKRHRLLTKRGSQFNEGSSQKQIHPAQAEYAAPLKTTMAAQALPYEYEYATTGTSSDEDGIPQAVRKESSSSMEFSRSPETKPLATKEFQVFWEPLRTTASGGREEAPTMAETAKRKPPPTPLVESDLNLSIFKDVPNGFLLSNRTGKRKISWQDQMALKV